MILVTEKVVLIVIEMNDCPIETRRVGIRDAANRTHEVTIQKHI